jgi:alkanesulfonate monooxygenase SsuD/methylene tetrahydromethanopterin reductase-like flavin-dependent oxidoreductase (luciferase family)
VPAFTDDPAGIIGLAVAAEQAGFDGFFLSHDHELMIMGGGGLAGLPWWFV